MPDVDVWFAIPSASVDKCRRVLPVWRAMGYKTAVLQNRERGEIPADVVVWADAYPGWAESINILHRQIVPAGAPIIVSGGDDMLPDPERSAGQIAREFLERFPDTFGVMQPQGDGFLQAKQYCGSPWLGRVFCRAMYGGRGAMCAAYRHNWADHELFWVSACCGALWERPDLSQFHDHFTRSGGAAPEYWTSAVGAADEADVRTFIARSWLGFPGAAPSPDEQAARGRGLDVSVFRNRYPHTAERYWAARYGGEILAGEPERRMRAALSACAERGRVRVAIFGAGTHTRLSAAALASPPVEIVALVDEDSRVLGAGSGGARPRLLGFPVLAPREAMAMGPHAVVLSSSTQEERLMERARASMPGVPIVRLYGEQAAEMCASGTHPLPPPSGRG